MCVCAKHELKSIFFYSACYLLSCYHWLQIAIHTTYSVIHSHTVTLLEQQLRKQPQLLIQK